MARPTSRGTAGRAGGHRARGAAAPRAVPPPVNDATDHAPVIRPAEAPRRTTTHRRGCAIATMLPHPGITYDSAPGAPGYRGSHSDLVPLTEGSPIRTAIRTIGEIIITMGLVLLLFAGYEIWGKAAIVSSHQADLDAAARRAVGQPDRRADRPTRPTRPAAAPPRPPRRRRRRAARSAGSTSPSSTSTGWSSRASRHHIALRARALPGHRAARRDRQLLGRRTPQPGHLLGPRPDPSGDAVVVETRTTFYSTG